MSMEGGRDASARKPFFLLGQCWTVFMACLGSVMNPNLMTNLNLIMAVLLIWILDSIAIPYLKRNKSVPGDDPRADHCMANSLDVCSPTQNDRDCDNLLAITMPDILSLGNVHWS